MSDLDTLRERMRNRATPRDTNWYSIRNADGDKAVLRIYDEIHWLFGVSADMFAEELAAITAPEIEVQINSPGGDVFDGIAIFNALRAHSAKVTTRVDGLAASAASVIAQAGDHRVMLSGSQMMVHEAWGVTVGPAADHREMADLLDKQSDIITGIYAERSGRDADELRGMVAAETWLSAEETVEAGLADEVVSPPRQETTTENSASVRVQVDTTDLDATLAKLREANDLAQALQTSPARQREEPAPPAALDPEQARSLLDVLTLDNEKETT